MQGFEQKSANYLSVYAGYVLTYVRAVMYRKRGRSVLFGDICDLR